MSEREAASYRSSPAEIAPDVFYEHRMLGSVVGLLYDGGETRAHVETGPLPRDFPPTVGDAEHNALVEAALVHLRNLDDFLGMPVKDRRADDVLAVDLAHGWTQQRIIDSDSRGAINKHLQHLTYRRAKTRAGWPLQRWEMRAKTLYLKFAGVVDDSEARRIVLHGPGSPEFERIL